MSSFQSLSELEQAVQTRVEKLNKFGLTIQPFVVVVGQNYKDIDNVYVKIDKNIYLMPSCLKALDVCFKSFHALQAEYPREAEQVWSFIQRGIYNITTKWDKSFTGVNALMADLKLCEQK